MRDIFKLILFTGQRPGEIMSMRVDELDFDMTIKVTRTDGKLEVEVEVDCPVWLLPSSKTKNERPHFVPLSPQVVEIIKNRVTESPWIFPSVYNKNQSGHTVSTKNARYKLHKDTGIKKWTAHDLRRTARTLMSRFGVRPHIAEKVINHSEGRMFQVYDHFDYLEEKQKALLVLASKIEKITN